MTPLPAGPDLFHHLRESLILFAIAGILVPLLSRLRLSPILSYLILGLAISPYALGSLAEQLPWVNKLVIHDKVLIRTLSELGVVFLMFMIGLELSLRRLWDMRRLVLGLGGLQITLTAAVITVTAMQFENSLEVSVLIGTSMALSSTAIVMQLLRDQHRLAGPLGSTCFSVLLMQDLAVVPILALLSAFQSESGNHMEALGEAMATAMVAIAAIFVAGRFVLRPLLRHLGAARSPEAFLALILFIIIGTAALTENAGLSAALGAFLAGLLIAETEYRHEVEIITDPLRGLFLGVFFLSIGISTDITAAARDPLLLLAGVLGLMALKTGILLMLMLAFRFPLSKSLEAAVLLSQAGEFALIIISMGLASGLMPTAAGQYFMLVTATSMMLTPLFAYIARLIAQRLQRHAIKLPDWLATTPVRSREEHFIIAGFGRVGMMLGQVLETHHIGYVAVDQNAQHVSKLRDLAYPVYYGDARRMELWKRLGASKAQGVLITVDEPKAAREMLRVVREHWPMLPVVVRAHDVKDVQTFYDLGATLVVPEMLEASLQLARQTLKMLGFDEASIEHTVATQRDLFSHTKA